MHETKVRTLGHPLETSRSALPVRPHQPRWLISPWVLVADTAEAMQRGGQEPRYRLAGGMRWENLSENRVRHRHGTKLGGPASSPATFEYLGICSAYFVSGILGSLKLLGGGGAFCSLSALRRRSQMLLQCKRHALLIPILKERTAISGPPPPPLVQPARAVSGPTALERQRGRPR